MLSFTEWKTDKMDGDWKSMSYGKEELDLYGNAPASAHVMMPWSPSFVPHAGKSTLSPSWQLRAVLTGELNPATGKATPALPTRLNKHRIPGDNGARKPGRAIGDLRPYIKASAPGLQVPPPPLLLL